MTSLKLTKTVRRCYVNSKMTSTTDFHTEIIPCICSHSSFDSDLDAEVNKYILEKYSKIDLFTSASKSTTKVILPAESMISLAVMFYGVPHAVFCTQS